MDFIRRRFSLSADPDKDTEEKTPSGNLLESLSSRRATLWSDFTSKIKSDKSDISSPEGDSKNELEKQVNGGMSEGNGAVGKSFMESVRQRLQNVKRSENGDRERDGPECAPLIDTGDSEGDGSDAATCGESEANGSTEIHVTVNGASVSEVGTRRKRLSKRQDSLTAEEVYLETVDAPVRNGVVKPDSRIQLLASPSKAIQEFTFNTANRRKKKASTGKKSSKANTNSLQVDNGNLINFDSIHNLSEAATNGAEIIVHREDDGVLDYESSGLV